jgi:hypothetical protein
MVRRRRCLRLVAVVFDMPIYKLANLRSDRPWSNTRLSDSGHIASDLELREKVCEFHSYDIGPSGYPSIDSPYLDRQD